MIGGGGGIGVGGCQMLLLSNVHDGYGCGAIKVLLAMSYVQPIPPFVNKTYSLLFGWLSINCWSATITFITMFLLFSFAKSLIMFAELLQRQ